MALPLPSTFTPSKLGKFTSCPLAFRYCYIEGIPEPPSIYQLRGTLLHRALQLLYSEAEGAERTIERAGVALAKASAELEQELATLELDENARRAFDNAAAALLASYFRIEDPSRVEPVGLELDLRAPLEDVELHGIIDRLDRLEDGRFVLTDYKTGRSPRPEQARSRLVGLQFYAYLCERALGVRPSEVRLMYLKDEVVIVESPTDQSMRGLSQRALAVWSAIERACDSEDFRPNPSSLCRSCSFIDRCPAHTSPAH